ncbi:MAG TPA: CvpA family protein [Candidatus Ruthenibacterium avium]|uniref:CvpA family protein n=1 Tax=Candidatus Ruthenibacterium avium TaxID=2838751 RepID=A0A9D2S153_9FIRM|nr:CvpA family protein [Candidatus Ruthenibacterium avium]
MTSGISIGPALILDVILIAVIVLTAFHYKKKGFVAGLLDLVGNLLALLVAWIASDRISPTVFENFFKQGLIEKITQTVQEQGTSGLTMLVENFSSILPGGMAHEVTRSLQDILGSGAPDLAVRIVDTILTPLIVPMITVVLFFIAFAVCKLVISMLVAVLTNINKIPVIGSVNELLGILVGVAGGVLNVVLLLCLIWAVVAITNNNLPVLNNDMLSGSMMYSLFSRYNPFL